MCIHMILYAGWKLFHAEAYAHYATDEKSTFYLKQSTYNPRIKGAIQRIIYSIMTSSHHFMTP